MSVRDFTPMGRGRIVVTFLWAPDDTDLLGPATIFFGGSVHGEITVGALTASLSLDYGRAAVFFRWHGSDNMTEVNAEGSAELLDDGAIEI